MPTTCDGRSVATASSTTGRVEVLVARMPSGFTMSSRRVKSSFFTARSSTTDSSTRSQSCSAWRSSVAVTRAPISLAAVSSSLPRSTCLASDFSSAATMASALACWRERRITSTPALAATSAMPDPMIPDPTIPSVAMPMGARRYRWVTTGRQNAAG